MFVRLLPLSQFSYVHAKTYHAFHFLHTILSFYWLFRQLSQFELSRSDYHPLTYCGRIEVHVPTLYLHNCKDFIYFIWPFGSLIVNTFSHMGISYPILTHHSLVEPYAPIKNIIFLYLPGAGQNPWLVIHTLRRLILSKLWQCMPIHYAHL